MVARLHTNERSIMWTKGPSSPRGRPGARARQAGPRRRELSSPRRKAPALLCPPLQPATGASSRDIEWRRTDPAHAPPYLRFPVARFTATIFPSMLNGGSRFCKIFTTRRASWGPKTRVNPKRRGPVL